MQIMPFKPKTIGLLARISFYSIEKKETKTQKKLAAIFWPVLYVVEP